jgi:hypothetical protein
MITTKASPSSCRCRLAAAGARVKAARSAPPRAATGLDARGAPWFTRPDLDPRGARSDCRRIFGLARSPGTPGHHGNPRAGSQSLCTASRASAVIGASPRRSDRRAMLRELGAVLRVRADSPYTGRCAATKGRCGGHTAQMIRASLFATATVATLWPRRCSVCTAQCCKMVGGAVAFACHKNDRAPCVSSMRR